MKTSHIEASIENLSTNLVHHQHELITEREQGLQLEKITPAMQQKIRKKINNCYHFGVSIAPILENTDHLSYLRSLLIFTQEWDDLLNSGHTWRRVKRKANGSNKPDVTMPMVDIGKSVTVNSHMSYLECPHIPFDLDPMLTFSLYLDIQIDMYARIIQTIQEVGLWMTHNEELPKRDIDKTWIWVEDSQKVIDHRIMVLISYIEDF
eukprot:NODE_147_length_17537_cov_0.265627.p9 type:complete len:207 gc:universal NODE_147_length_17537_cov_0.265627:7052-7672(+)